MMKKMIREQLLLNSGNHAEVSSLLNTRMFYHRMMMSPWALTSSIPIPSISQILSQDCEYKTGHCLHVAPFIKEIFVAQRTEKVRSDT